MRLTPTKLFLLLAAWFLATPFPANGITANGRLGASFYSYSDDVSIRDYTVSRYRLKLDVKDIYGDRVFISFKGSARNAIKADINNGIPRYRVTRAKVIYRKAYSMFDLILGRDYIGEMAGARVDGLHIKTYLQKNAGIGVFGGFQPNPHDDSFNSDYTTYGAYGFLREPGYGGSLGYARSNLKSRKNNKIGNREDFSYFFGSGYYLPARELSIYTSARTDRDIENGSYKFTNFLVSVNFRLSRIARMGISFNQYRAIKLLESMDYSLNYELQNSYRFTHVFNVTKTFRISGKIESRKRSSDNASASLYDIGIRQSEIFKWLFVEITYRYINYFTSNVVHYHAATGVEMSDDMTFEVAGTYSQDDRSNNFSSLRQWIYSASIDWYVTRTFYVSGRYEASSEKYLDVESVYLKKATDGYKSSSFYLQGNYKF